MMGTRKPVRLTRATRRVLLVLLTDLPRLSAYPISMAAGVGAGGVYIVLARLERAGWVAAEWEEGVPVGHRRRFYRLTDDGYHGALGMLGLSLLARQGGGRR